MPHYPHHFRFFRRFFAGIALAVGIFAAPAAQAEELRINVAHEHAPFSYIDEAGNLTGFNTDIAYALCDAMQRPCAVSAQAQQTLIDNLLSRRTDAVIASLPTNDADNHIAFTDRYYKNGGKFARKVGAHGRISYKGILGKSVGVQEGTIYDDFLSNEFDGIVINRYGSLEAAYAALQEGKINLVFAEQFRQLEEAAKYEDIEVAGPTYTKSSYFSSVGIAVRADDESLRQALNQALQTIRANGAYKTVNKRYFPFNIYGRGR